MKITKCKLFSKFRRNLTGGLFLLALFISMSTVSYSEEGLSDIEYKGMVKIPGGSFMMGSNERVAMYLFNNEQPIHKVTLDAFYMDATEVKQADYLELMGVNPSYHTGEPQLPVESVTWFDAVLYCNARSKRDGLEPVYSFTSAKINNKKRCKGLVDLKIDFGKNGYRLPTEAEWEYACRAGTTTLFYWGDKMNGDYAWWYGNSTVMTPPPSRQQTHPVGTKIANAWGLFDMSGNVWEWCHDWYDQKYYYDSSEQNPQGPVSGQKRIARGGGYTYDVLDNGNNLRSAFRANGVPNFYINRLGFRCVRVP